MTHVIWVAALQRLANGIGVRLLREDEFRESRLRGYEFYSDRAGAVVFKVELVHSDRGNVLREVKEMARI